MANQDSKKSKNDTKLTRAKDLPATQGMLYAVRDELKAQMKSGYQELEARVIKVETQVGHLENGLASHKEEMKLQFSRLEQKIDAHHQEVSGRFGEVTSQFEQVDTRFEQVDARFEQMDARFDLLEQKTESRFNSLEQKMDSHLLQVATLLKAKEKHCDQRFHEIQILVEEQNARNKYVLDGIIALNFRQDRLEKAWEEEKQN